MRFGWCVDDALYETVTPKEPPRPWVYDHQVFIILNVTVGGYWPGSPRASDTAAGATTLLTPGRVALHIPRRQWVVTGLAVTSCLVLKGLRA